MGWGWEEDRRAGCAVGHEGSGDSVGDGRSIEHDERSKVGAGGKRSRGRQALFGNLGVRSSPQGVWTRGR